MGHVMQRLRGLVVLLLALLATPSAAQFGACLPAFCRNPLTCTPVGGPLIAQYDASVFGSLSFSGSDIIQVADQSGNCDNLTTTAGSITPAPTYNATGLNGLPTMVFTGQGTDDVNNLSPLSFNGFQIGTGNTLTFWFVGESNSTAVGFSRGISYLGLGEDHDYDNAGSWAFFRNSTTPDIGIIRNNQTIVPGTTANTPHIWIGTVKSDGTMTVYIDGVSGGTATQVGNWINGGLLGVGGGAIDFDATWKGNISEIGIRTDFFDATAVNTLYLALKAKWAF